MTNNSTSNEESVNASLPFTTATQDTTTASSTATRGFFTRVFDSAVAGLSQGTMGSGPTPAPVPEIFKDRRISTSGSGETATFNSSEKTV